jgi:DNA end-binding protein Ku
MRAIWTGAIGFGLVNIPVKIYSATRETRPDFDLLDRKSLSRIRYKRVNEETGKEVEWSDIVKGHYLKDKYIVLEESDFEAASPEKTKLIQLKSFVSEAEIDSIYYESPYYLSPQKGGEKAYSLLHRALQKSKKAGLSAFVMRNAENLAVIRAHDNILVLNKLRFQEEIRPTADLKVNLPSVSKPEMDMAMQLVKRHSETFDIRNYKDEYSKELNKRIRAKAKGKHPTIRKLKASTNDSRDLLEQLKASLA